MQTEAWIVLQTVYRSDPKLEKCQGARPEDRSRGEDPKGSPLGLWMFKDRAEEYAEELSDSGYPSKALRVVVEFRDE
jgi:hypothetical protein